MLPSLEELRKSLVPEKARGRSSDSKADPQLSIELAPSANLASSEFRVLCQPSTLFAPRRAVKCRMCLTRPEPAIVLRAKHGARPSRIARSSLSGWLKHDLVFFGESHVCERCAKKEGFI